MTSYHDVARCSYNTDATWRSVMYVMLIDAYVLSWLSNKVGKEVETFGFMMLMWCWEASEVRFESPLWFRVPRRLGSPPSRAMRSPPPRPASSWDMKRLMWHDQDMTIMSGFPEHWGTTADSTVDLDTEDSGTQQETPFESQFKWRQSSHRLKHRWWLEIRVSLGQQNLWIKVAEIVEPCNSLFGILHSFAESGKASTLYCWSKIIRNTFGKFLEQKSLCYLFFRVFM